jgi:hypothetical protein
MLTLLAAACALQAQAPIVPLPRPGLEGRGRDPWVFRAIFEDRTRMLIIAPAPNWWMAFNPETGAMHKVWHGKMNFRGKVWDFSQDNSRAEGRIYLASPSEIFRLVDGSSAPANWTATGVTPQKDGWLFPDSKRAIVTPPLDLSGWHRVFIAFDETGKKGRFHVDIADRKSAVDPQWFESATSVEGENSWQWNFKRIERPSSATVIKITSNVPGKRLRSLRLYGDRPSWFDSKGQPLEVIWDGYELVKETRAVNINYRLRLPSGKLVSVQQKPELTKTGWIESWEVKGLPRGEVIRLRREGLSEGVIATGRPSGGSPFAQDGWAISSDGEQRLIFDIRNAVK